MKKFKKMAALLLAMGMSAVMAAPAFAAYDKTDPNHSTADTVTVTGLAETTTGVTAYQIITAEYSSGTVEYALTNWAKAALANVAAAQKNGAVDTDTVITALGGIIGSGTYADDKDEQDYIDATGILAALAGYAANQDESAGKTVPADLTKAGTVSGQAGTFTGLKVGSYLVLAADSAAVYNPMVVSVNYKTDANGSIDRVEANGTVAKYSTVDIDKKIDENGGVRGNTAQVGDSVPYVITGNFPNYDSNQTNIQFVITDELGEGLTPPADASEIRVYVGSDTTNAITLEGDDAVTMDGQKITVNLSKTAVKYKTQNYTIRYTAAVNEKAKTGFDPNTNTVKLKYTNGPGKNDTSETKEKKTYTYTFAIDGGVWGSTITNGSEIKKTGEGAYSRTADDPVYSENAALEGAEFTLYYDADCKNAVSGEDLKGANPVSTGKDGFMTFEGLEGNTSAEGTTVYYLKETKAPDGYSVNETVYAVKFVVQLADDGQIQSYTVYVNGTAAVAYQYSSADPATVVRDNKVRTTEEAGGSKWVAAEIKNTKLSSLPSTGGIGTTIFTVAGCAIMIAAAGLLLAARTKKKRGECI